MRRQTWVLVSLAALGGALSCGSPGDPPGGSPSATASASQAAAPSSAAPRASAASAAAGDPKLDAVLDAVVMGRPSVCRSLGMRKECDGKVADYSSDGIKKRIAALEDARRTLETVDKLVPGSDADLDRALLRLAVQEELFGLVDLARWQKRPQFYDELFAVEAYLTRDYAPLDDRVRSMVLHVKAALAQTDHIAKNLAGPLPEAFVKTDIGIFKGYAEYLRGDVLKLIAPVKDEALRTEATAAVKELADRAEAVAKHLEKVELPRADQSYALGPDKYKKLLLVQESLDTSLDELSAMAEEDLARNKKAYEELQAKVKVSRPDAKALLESARKVTFEGKDFLEKKGLVTIPPEGKLEIKETPPFMRWNSAFLDGPGPFDRPDLVAYYYITLPDPKWSAKEQEEYIMAYGTLMATSVHEVFPGHFLQGQWARRAPTRAQKSLGSYSFVEGWAHYAEELMVEHGFGESDPQNRLGQLGDALLRNCRFVVSIGLHARGMTVAQAQERFEKDCFQDKATAKQQAYRGTFDPGYFAYTLGKIQIRKLKAEAKQALGPKFDEKKFHDALLSHGSPPVPLIRDRVLRAIGAR
jgi:uncharacterized protein (DUF885 family)